MDNHLQIPFINSSYQFIEIDQIMTPCSICNILLQNNSFENNNNIVCLSCNDYLNNTNLWQCKNNSLHKNRVHKVFKNTKKDFYIITEKVYNKNTNKFLLYYHYAKKLKIIYCINCLKDSISFDNIQNDYCPKCSCMNTISSIYYRWVIITNKYQNFPNIEPKIKNLKYFDLQKNYTFIEEYNEKYFNYEKLYLLKNNYCNQSTYELKYYT
jgi:hypothetical protein